MFLIKKNTLQDLKPRFHASRLHGSEEGEDEDEDDDVSFLFSFLLFFFFNLTVFFVVLFRKSVVSLKKVFFLLFWNVPSINCGSLDNRVLG